MFFSNNSSILSYVDKRQGLVLPFEATIELAEIIGILAGDGYVGGAGKGENHRIEISCNLKDELPYVQHVWFLLHKIFNVEFSIQINANRCVATIIKRSQGITTFLQSIGYQKKNCQMQIPSWLWVDESLARAFIRGLFDTDGSLCLKKNHGRYEFYPVISIALKDELLIRRVAQWAGKQKIPYYVGKDSYLDPRTNKKYTRFRLQISGYKNAAKWIALVGTSNQKNRKKISAARFERAIPNSLPFAFPVTVQHHI